MKKRYVLVGMTMMMLAFAACGSEKNIEKNKTQTENKETASEEKEEKKEEAAKDEEESETITSEDMDELEAIMSEGMEKLSKEVEKEYSKLKSELNSYDAYVKNIGDMEAFYEGIAVVHKEYCIEMRKLALAYGEHIIESDCSQEDKYEELDAIYDYIYDDGGDDLYDLVYDDLFDELYDDFYDGILDDAYDDVEYDEWSDIHSQEYDWWSDTHSEIYDDWSDMKSDVYDFWSDLKGEVWSDDLERANKKIEKFQKKIDKLQPENSEENVAEDETKDIADKEDSKDAEKTSNKKEELVDGMRPAFKEAMDSYESFYEDYVALMKEYNENPGDMELMAKSVELMEKSIEVNEKFEAWDEDEMNDAELKYYLKVQARVLEKLADVQ